MNFCELALLMLFGVSLVFSGCLGATQTPAQPTALPTPTTQIALPPATPKASSTPAVNASALHPALPAASATPFATPTPQAPVLINGKTLAVRLQEAHDRLHTSGSGQNIRDNFPDITLVYTDGGQGRGFPGVILPFKYYYSAEANTTFTICNIDFTVIICNGKVDRLVTNEDLSSRKCEATPAYTNPYGG